jgi:hypothetical protein
MIAEGGQTDWFSSDPHDISESGVHTLYIADAQDSGGMYTLTVTIAGNPVLGEVETSVPVTNTMRPNLADTWTFEGVAGQQVVIVVEASNPEIAMQLELLDNSGAQVSLQRSVGLAEIRVGSISLPTDGMYTVRITGYNFTEGVTYSLVVRPPTEDEDTRLVQRLNHFLGISFNLPANFELVNDFLAIYGDGTDEIWFAHVRDIQDQAVETFCEARLAEHAAFFTSSTMSVDIVQQDDFTKCNYRFDSDDALYRVGVILNEERIASTGEVYNHFEITAPLFGYDGVLEAISDSLALVEPSEVDPAQYLDEALRMIAVNYVYLDQLDWDRIVLEAKASLNEDSDLDDAREALYTVFDQLGTIGAHGSQFIPFNPVIAEGQWDGTG